MAINRMQQGFTLLELMVVVAIFGILAAIAYPNYMKYVKQTKRADMMVAMQNISQQLTTQKIMVGRGEKANIAAWVGTYPKDATPLYNLTIDAPNTREFTIIATPITNGQMQDDGTLKLYSDGKKCRNSQCGMGEEWRN